MATWTTGRSLAVPTYSPSVGCPKGQLPQDTYPLPKHPGSKEWYWVDATAWCALIGDTLSPTFTVQITQTDGNLVLVSTTMSPDSLKVGFYLIGGTSGYVYGLTVTLNGLQENDTIAVDIFLGVLSKVTLESQVTVYIPALDFSDYRNSMYL